MAGRELARRVGMGDSMLFGGLTSASFLLFANELLRWLQGDPAAFDDRMMGAVALSAAAACGLQP